MKGRQDRKEALAPRMLTYENHCTPLNNSVRKEVREQNWIKLNFLTSKFLGHNASHILAAVGDHGIISQEAVVHTNQNQSMLIKEDP